MEASLDQKIKHLERINKIFIALFVFIAIIAVSFGFALRHAVKNMVLSTIHSNLVTHSIETDSIRTHSIEVVGSHGKNSVSLGASRDGWDSLSFRDLDGQLRASLLLTPSGKPSLDFFGEKTNRISIGVVDAPSGDGEEFSIQLLDANHNVIWHPNVNNSLRYNEATNGSKK